MTIKLDALASWKRIQKNEALLLPHDREDARRIRIDMNCEDQTWVYVAGDEIDGAQFVAAVGPGLETVEFYAGGDLAVTFVPAVPEDRTSQVWIYTAEIEPNVSEVPDAVSFFEIHQRGVRDPQLERMMQIARHNERRMDAKLARMEALAAQLEGAEDDDTGTSDGAAGASSEQSAGGDRTSSGENKAGASEPAGGADDDTAA